MSQVLRKWIADQAVNNDKIDPTDIYTITGLRVDETNAVGRVAIGLSNPLDALHIRRTDTSAGIILDLDDGGSGQSYHLYSDQSGVFNIKDEDAGIVRFSITSNPSVGRVGINDSTPQDTIHARSTLLGSALRLDTDDGFNGRAYRLISDTDGIFKIVDVDAGSAIRLQIASTGTLTVSGDATFNSNFQINGTVTVINTEIIVSDQLEINQTDNQPALIASQDTPGTTATVVLIENAGDGAALTTDFGNVGIGTLIPEGPLHVHGDILTTTGYNIGDTTHRIGTLWMDSTVDYLSGLNFSSGGVHVTFTTGGNVGIGSTIPAQALDVVGNMVTSANITSTSGNISATTGSVSAGATVTGGTGVTATTGNISALAGNVIGGTGVTATTGNISALACNVIAFAQLQGASLNTTAGPNDMTGTTSVTGVLSVQSATNVQLSVVRTGAGTGSAIFGVTNAPGQFGWQCATGNSLIQSSTGENFHIGSSDQIIPSMTFTSTGAMGVANLTPLYSLHFGGDDAGAATVQDKIGFGYAASNTGVAGAGWGIHFLHRNTGGTTFQSRISSVIGSAATHSDIVLSPSGPAQVALEGFRLSRPATTTTELTVVNNTGSGLLDGCRIKTIYNSTSYLRTTDIGAIDGGQTHITCQNNVRAISILSAGATLGFVGIGVTPTQKLHVQGNGLFTGNLQAASLTIPILNVTGPNTAHVQLSINRTAGGSTIYAVTNDDGFYGWSTATAADDSIIQSSTGQKLHLGTDDLSAPTMTLTNTGSVGIGTTSPAEDLHLYKATGVNTFRIEAAASSVNVEIRFDTASAGGTWFYEGGSERGFINSLSSDMNIANRNIANKINFMRYVPASFGYVANAHITGGGEFWIETNALISDQVSTRLGSEHFLVYQNGASLSEFRSVTSTADVSIISALDSRLNLQSTTDDVEVNLQCAASNTVDLNFIDNVTQKARIQFTGQFGRLDLQFSSALYLSAYGGSNLLTLTSAGALTHAGGSLATFNSNVITTANLTTNSALIVNSTATFSTIVSPGAAYTHNIAVNNTGVAQANPVQVLYLAGTSPGGVSTSFSIDLSSYTSVIDANKIVNWSVIMESADFGASWYREQHGPTTDNNYFTTAYHPLTDVIDVDNLGTSLDDGSLRYRCAIWYHT